MSTMSAFQLDVLLDELVDRVADRVVQRLGSVPSSRTAELLSIAEAAELLRCKPQRVYDLRSSGRLPRTVEGGRAVVRRADVERLVSEYR
jgi:excisionase family DNA binding protein